MISPAQCRAARALLDWSQTTLAETARVGVATVRLFESGKTSPHNATLDVIIRTFELAGIEFISGDAPGVKLHATLTRKKKR
jgi:DNA-binding transcriptional regulator YiaG